jgi:membrane protein required for colicin V production
MTFSIAALNLVDYAVIFILIVSAILSTLRGMTREALGLAGWPISIFAAKYTAPVIEPTISDIIPVDGLGDALSWALPFAVADRSAAFDGLHGALDGAAPEPDQW